MDVQVAFKSYLSESYRKILQRLCSEFVVLSDRYLVVAVCKGYLNAQIHER